MSRLYGPLHRSLQDRFDTRRLADNTEARVGLLKFRRNTKRLSKAATCFFCRRSITRAGRPSHIRVAIRASSVSSTARPSLFPAMTATACSIRWATCSQISTSACCSLISKSRNRLRLQGLATVHDNDPLLPEYPEAQLIVRVAVTEIFRNCPRYVHHYRKIEPSKFVPRSTGETPIAPWKRVDDIQEALPARIESA